MDPSPSTAAADQGPDWSALSAGALQPILRFASTSQAPGMCLAASVCSTWRSAAAGCSRVRLVYHAGHPAADASLVAWLANNSHKLEAFLVCSDDEEGANTVLGALAQASTAAAAAGRPLRLHTLRVLTHATALDIAGRLLGSLPHLVCLQLSHSSSSQYTRWRTAYAGSVQEHLAPLKIATQLQELYMAVPGSYIVDISTVMSKLLPPGLKRLSWQDSSGGQGPAPDLSHMEHLTTLQLSKWDGLQRSSHLPPNLRELELCSMPTPLKQLQEQQQQLIGYERARSLRPLEKVAEFQQLRSIFVLPKELCDPAVRADLARLTNLSTLYLDDFSSSDREIGNILPALQGMPSLRQLHVRRMNAPVISGLHAVTGLTRLTLPLLLVKHAAAWAEALGHMPALKWLSVPGQMLLVERPWLGSLQQLRVLVVQDDGGLRRKVESREGVQGVSVTWGEEWALRALPPKLRVLNWHGLKAGLAASLQLRRRLQRLVSSSGCEVVVGPNLDEVADPIQQLAGLPVELQQVLQDCAGT